MSKGGTLGLAGGKSLALPRAIKNLGAITAGQGGYYSGTLVMVITAILKAVSLSGGHTVAKELPTGMGIKQSSSLMLSMHVCTKGLKRIGTNQGVATSQLGGTQVHVMHAGGRFGISVK